MFSHSLIDFQTNIIRKKITAIGKNVKKCAKVCY